MRLEEFLGCLGTISGSVTLSIGVEPTIAIFSSSLSFPLQSDSGVPPGRHRMAASQAAQYRFSPSRLHISVSHTPQ